MTTPDASVRVSTLDNGLRVVTDTMDTVETVSVGAWVAIGTRHESAAVNGISHFLEHMAFKGTATRDARAIAEEIEAVGGHLNAYTTREYTAYYAKVLKEDTALAVDILADILQNAVVDDEEFERERAVILQEIHQAHDTPEDIIFDHFQASAFPGQALGRPVLGTVDMVRDLRRQSLVDYMHDHYKAPRMVLSAAGRIEHAHMVDLVQRAFGDLGADTAVTVEPADYRGGEHRESRELEQVQFLMGFKGVNFTDPDFYGASAFSTILGGGMSSRLFQEIRETHGLAYSIYSFLSCYSDVGMFSIYAGTGEDEVTKLIPLICDEIVRVRDDISETEVRRAAAQLKSSILMSMESTSSRCEQRARQMLIYGRPLAVQEIVGRIDGLTVDAVRRAARRLTAAPLTLAAMGPIGRLEATEAIAARLA
ncbi:MAG: insulinase family protein [Hyphomicrobiales bacterium]|nr:insulinase family protein [Hyphomicrobiales bacterium]